MAQLSCSEIITSQEYADFLLEWFVSPLEFSCEQRLTPRFRIVHLPLNERETFSARPYGYLSVPGLCGLMDIASMDVSGITRLQNQPYLNLNGKGVLVGVIDTGIEYQNPVFLNSAGKTRIASIWDQTISNGQPPEGFLYGTEFRESEINEALQNGEWLGTYDGLGSPEGDEIERRLYEQTAGHGTFLAAVAAGSRMGNEFTGAAPESELVIVKLKQSKQYLQEYYQVSASLPSVQDNDIMTGVNYLLAQAEKFQKPLVILLGLGTNAGDHNGNSVLAEYLETVATANGIIVVCPAGNEAINEHHFYGSVENMPYREVEFRVGQGVEGFVMELWGNQLQQYEVALVAPNGESTAQIPASIGGADNLSFSFIPTKATVQYWMVTHLLASQLIWIRLKNPTAGIWKLRVYEVRNGTDGFHIWLPIAGFLTGEVSFLQPDPYVTVTEPGNNDKLITAGTYQFRNDSIWLESGRGYTREGAIKPDLVAPGVGIDGPGVYLGAMPQPARTSFQLVSHTGSSISAAHVAGACAQLLEWAVVKGNLPVMNTPIAKGYLITGARRLPQVAYPNREWGYGALDVYGAIENA